MKQEVFVIGRNLRDLVPFSLTFISPDYDLTLIETPHVVSRAAALACQQEAWFLLILAGDDVVAEWQALEESQPSRCMAIDDGGDPVIALAHLIAATTWDEAALADAPVATPLEANQHHG
jgi:hypothetical protein